MTPIILYFFISSLGGYVPEWHYGGTFSSPVACHQAAANLGLERKHKCIDSSAGVER